MIEQEIIEELVNEFMICTPAMDAIEFKRNDYTEQLKSSMLKILLPDEMIRLINEDLGKLDSKELGRVYKFIRRDIIASIPKEET